MSEEYRGCENCRHIGVDEWSEPCKHCIRNMVEGDDENNFTDNWTPMDGFTPNEKNTTASIRRTILREAEKSICGQREQDYGSPESNFAIIAQLWTAYTGYDFTSLDVAMMMCLLKIARIKNGGGTGDSFVDLAGYAACGAEIAGECR